MRHEYNLDLETCHKNLQEFIKGLREVIGENASAVIENLVARKLCTSLSLKGEDKDFSLLELIERLKSLKDEDPKRIEKEA